MKYQIYILVLISHIAYGQYKHDHTLKHDPFFKTVDSHPDRKCGIHSIYYEQQEGYGINDAGMECYVLQEQIKDTLRARFTDKELFEIAQYSKTPFYRIAAFELYSQTDYPKDEVIGFFKRGNIPSVFLGSATNDTIPEIYIPMPNSLLPGRAAIRFKMLDILDPAAKRRTQKDTPNGFMMIDVPRYPKSKPLDLENFVSVLCYMRYYCEEHTYSYGVITYWKPGEKKPKIPTFYIADPVVDFGTIDLDYLDSTKTYFELRGAIKVINNTSQSITLNGQASAHTMCTKDKYVIPPQQEMMIEFKSLVELHRPIINRTITLTDVKTGDTRVFGFKAKFIHTKTRN